MFRRGNTFMKCLTTFILVQLVKKAIGHPQCLDFRAPFDSEVTLGFCSEYSSFGCCTQSNDEQIRRNYVKILSLMTADDRNACGGYVRDFVCQRCSPYAAHIYDAEGSWTARSFPGLCKNYCRTFYRNCRNIVKYLTDDYDVLEHVRYGTTAFCNHVALSDTDYCFPDLKSNDLLNNRISIVQFTSEGCLCMEPFAVGLYNPVFARHPGDGSGRLFVGEVGGTISVYYLNGSREHLPFLDIRHKTVNSKYEGDERGLLGLAFHPKFKQNQKFYLYYSTQLQFGRGQFGNHKIRLSEFLVSKANKNIADANSERVLLEIEQPFWNHNGGELLFGDDGYLYMFVGDGGSAGDPLGNSQNTSVLLGKVLRLDVDVGPNSLNPYNIPRDNPFVDNPAFRPEIYAYGVRNMWRCGKDRGDPVTGEGKGRIVCGDVGQSAFEELDLLKKGVNYGWNSREGLACYNEQTCGHIGKEELPIHSYPHYVGKSVTGGHFYRGCLSPNLNGFYIYGDYMNGRLFRLLHDPKTDIWNNKELHMCGADMCTPPLINIYNPHILSFGEDEHGELYMLSTSRASSADPGGHIYKIVDPARRGNPSSCKDVGFTVPQLTTTPLHFPTTSPILPTEPNIVTQGPNIRTSTGANMAAITEANAAGTSTASRTTTGQIGRSTDFRNNRKERRRKSRKRGKKRGRKRYRLLVKGIRIRLCTRKPGMTLCRKHFKRNKKYSQSNKTSNTSTKLE